MADVSTEVAIATQTLGSSAATLTFSSIPSSYTDLRLVLTTTTVSTGENIIARFNSDSTSNYSYTAIYAGTGLSPSSASNANTSFLIFTQGGGTSNTIPCFYTADIFSYTGSTYKTSLLTSSEDKNTSGYVERYVGLWRSTSAINRIDLSTYGGSNLAAGTTATLYGIL
jgi:hypothetical protein